MQSADNSLLKAVGGYLYDRCEKTKEAEYQRGYKAGQQSQPKSQ